MSEYQVVDRPEDHRFALTRDGDDIGFAAYRRADGVITFTHTEVDQSLQEHGLGSRLAQGALDAVRDGSSDRVVLQCPFMAAYVSRHPEYDELTTREPDAPAPGLDDQGAGGH